MIKKQFKKSISGTFATGIILEKELSTDEVLNELIKLEKEIKELKVTIGEMEDYLARMEEENKELKAFKEKVFEWIDGEIDSVKESCNVLMTSDEAEAIMNTLIELKIELSGEKND